MVKIKVTLVTMKEEVVAAYAKTGGSIPSIIAIAHVPWSQSAMMVSGNSRKAVLDSLTQIVLRSAHRVATITETTIDVPGVENRASDTDIMCSTAIGS